MILIVGAISVISLVLNILIYRKIADAVKPVYFDISIQPIEQEVVVEQPEEAHDPQPVVSTKAQEAYQGWQNKQGVPWFETQAPASTPIKQAANNGPLARPDGFV